jgi:diguanylate cyclase
VARQIEAGDENADFAVETSSFEARELVDALRGMADTLLNRQQALVESNRQVMQHAVELEDGNKQLQRLSRQDALTGLANRLAADERLNDEFVRMQRTSTGYVVLLMDIDFFKRVNDTLGHAVGDEVLRHVGSILKWRLRESDFLARYGGEEFLAILPATDVAAARKVAEKIRSALQTEPLPAVGTITLSIGLAMSRPEQRTADEVVIEADRWLYAAKRTGRNQVAGFGIETSHELRQGQAAGSG